MLVYRPLDLLIFLGVAIIWGLNFVVAKVGLTQLPPLLFVALRFALVAALLAPFLQAPKGKLLPIFLISITLGLLHFSLMFTGLRDIDAATAAIAIQLQVPFAALLAALVFKERLGWQRATGMMIAFAGVALLAGGPRLDGHYLALAFVIAAACIWSVANVQIKLLGEMGGIALNGWLAVFATPQLLLASAALEFDQWSALAEADWRSLAAVVYQAILVVIVGYGTWYQLLRRYDINQAMPFTLLVPLVGVASGVALLGEALTLNLILGGILTLGGTAIIVLRRTPAAQSDRQTSNTAE